MSEALNGFLKTERGRKIERVELIGYSGGGALSVLLADQVKGISKVVTLAGNLDHKAWTESFGYLPLFQSLNPIRDARLGKLPALHIAGADDENIKPEIIKSFVAKHGGELVLLEGVDHNCCWLEYWPELLTRIERLH
ncbi:alpha/beta fold hydrolase [Pseudoteredinibacter isoporae]|uniref:Dienelactone hydrolase n=1 Tax=Pseudoteredinibacter isoporae TaxID=570281 RepID=A0A7X0JWW5_9GAMM|nr:hypothetical protein [Pseudoteredinibacter isoporae]MBB6523000.1 dienelactone hydrolase [Pseudoteredinibacter isoporae]NHO88524.1 hypothetical protein [Pseudoteredinibacter isoporae]NIB22077.1 hypothetical protein [Pseudoteredinibacter isoporae]